MPRLPQGVLDAGEHVVRAEVEQGGGEHRVRTGRDGGREVLVARRWVMIDYDIRRDLLEAATAVTPGLESPTVSPLRDETMVAVRSMVRKPDANRVMDELYALGARGILISAIHAIRL